MADDTNFYPQVQGQPGNWGGAIAGGGFGGGYGGGDINQAGAQNDPFAYTQGSLLTPWSGSFDSSKYAPVSGTSYQAAAFTPFNYANFDGKQVDVGQFNETYNDPAKFAEQYNDPAAFRFADFSGPSDFRAPSAEAMRADPGYQARMDAVKNAQIAAGAHGGALRTGGFQKGMAKAIGDQASQEYGNVYQRQAGEHDRLRSEAEKNYSLNQGNTFQAQQYNNAQHLQGYQARFGANQQDIENKLKGYQTRQGAWQANADVGLKQGELNYNIGSGTWDRNEGMARQGWSDQMAQNERIASAANASAASGAAAANANYARDLGDYTRGRDEFWTNQDRQYNILDREANRGQNAATTYGNQMMNGAQTQADYMMGNANTQASATMGSANAWGNYASGLGNTVGGLAAYGGVNGGINGGGGGGYGGYYPTNTPQPLYGSRGGAMPPGNGYSGYGSFSGWAS